MPTLRRTNFDNSFFLSDLYRRLTHRKHPATRAWDSVDSEHCSGYQYPNEQANSCITASEDASEAIPEYFYEAPFTKAIVVLGTETVTSPPIALLA